MTGEITEVSVEEEGRGRRRKWIEMEREKLRCADKKRQKLSPWAQTDRHREQFCRRRERGGERGCRESGQGGNRSRRRNQNRPKR
jgi:hypothetical protein